MATKKPHFQRRPVDAPGRFALMWPKDATGAKQAFGAEVDINAIVQRFLSTGHMPPPTQAAVFADMTKVPATLHEAMVSLRNAQALISKLPPTLRSAFERDPLGTLDALVRAQAGGAGASGAGSGPASEPRRPAPGADGSNTAPPKAAPGASGPQAGGQGGAAPQA